MTTGMTLAVGFPSPFQQKATFPLHFVAFPFSVKMLKELHKTLLGECTLTLGNEVRIEGD